MQKEWNVYLDAFLFYEGFNRGQKYANKVHFFAMLTKFTLCHNLRLGYSYTTKFSGLVDQEILRCLVWLYLVNGQELLTKFTFLLIIFTFEMGILICKKILELLDNEFPKRILLQYTEKIYCFNVCY